MSILASKRGGFERKFSKELFTEVAENLKVFTDEEWASIVNDETVFNDHKEVLIAVYIRTDVENLVLLINKESFASISNVPSFITDSGIYSQSVIDAGLICSKSLIDTAFNFKSAEAMKRLVVNSVCFPVGAVETPKNYVLVFNVVMSENLLRDTEISLNAGFHFHPIESLCLTDSLQKEISESLILVKRG